MGSTDSAGSAHGGGPSCGLVSSLFPSSCRGRAEAFARRLHRRLTSLGGENADGSTHRKPENNGKQPRETSWLQQPSSTGGRPMIPSKSISTNHVLQRQPRHNPETDLYYDFDLDLEYEDPGPGSPAEEATAAELAELLVNREIVKTNCHRDTCRRRSPDLEARASDLGNQDPEFGCVFASPVTGTSPDSISDSSEVYFDPESSDISDKPKDEVFFDPVSTTSTSTSENNEVALNLANGSLPPDRIKNLISRGKTVNRACPLRAVDTSESSSSISRRNGTYTEKRRGKEELAGSSDDSLNGRSSLETTSASHDSLWSTFDESTVSLQDESPSRSTCNSIVSQNRLPKSHSDSEITFNGTRIPLTRKLPRRGEGELGDGVDELDYVNGISSNGEAAENVRNMKNLEELKDQSEANPEIVKDETKAEVEEVNEKEGPTSVLRPNEAGTSDNDTDHSTYSSTINIPGALTLECPSGERSIETTMKNEVKLQIDNGIIFNGCDEQKMCFLLTKIAAGADENDDQGTEATTATRKIRRSTGIDHEEVEEEEEEEEEEEQRPRRIRRCSSLKTGKTPPGTPGRKKIVRFADVLGLDLADVRTFLDEIPKVPNSAYRDLIYDDIFQKDPSPANNIATATAPIGNNWNNRYAERRASAPPIARKVDRTLVPLFQQPGGMPNFLDLVRERRVCLENVFVQDPVSLCIRGTVRVINLDFNKSVHIRYTLNAWKNFSDLQATYVPNSCDGFSDKFSFVLYCHTLTMGQRLEFAVRFQCRGTQYWDNNAGVNYCFQCLPISSAVEYIPITATSGGTGEQSQTNAWSAPLFY